MARFHITFSESSYSSSGSGADFGCYGWVLPRTEALRYVDDDAVRRMVDGEFRWPTLRAALDWMRDNATGPLVVSCDHYEPGYVTVSCEQDGPDVDMGPGGYQYSDVRTAYTLHIACRPARAERLAPALARAL